MKRDAFTQSLDLGHELIIDNFAGGGGTSEGLEQAFGRPVDIAINHDPIALAMHAMNHPHTRHLCESVWTVDPLAVTNNEPVGLVWLSPDCKHFSPAKGGVPVDRDIRALAWIALKWAALCKPRVIMLENVPEFKNWGPVIVDANGDARPDKSKRGKTFESFIRQLRAHGYMIEWKEIRAYEQGAPTIRNRLYLVARRDGIPISWPKATHGNPATAAVLAGKLLPWATAAECIDFNRPARSIFGRKKPLAVNSQRRVAKGIWRHVFNTATPYIVGAGVLDCLPNGSVLTPFIGEHANSSNDRTMPAAEPLRTLCAQVKGGHFSAVAPVMTPLRGTTETHLTGRSLRLPATTVSAGGTHHALAAAHLTHLTHHGERSGNDVREPVRTITGAQRGEQALIAACFEQANGGFYDGDGRPAQAPLSTICGSGSNQRLVNAYFVKYYGTGGQWQAADDPMHTLPTKARMGLVQTIRMPIDCLAEEFRERARLCAELLHTHLPEHFPEAVDMVMLGDWVLVDITLRMLVARELYRAQSFRESYIIDRIPDPELLFKDGVQVPGDPRLIPTVLLTITDQIRMCGNSVCPLMSEALARSSNGHERLMQGVAA